MNIKLYKNTSPVNAINKVLTDEEQVTVTLKRDFDFSQPTLTLSRDYSWANYVVFPELERSYFITDKTMINYALMTYELQCDLLQTYKNLILGADCLYRRTIQEGDYDVVDFDKTFTTTSTEFYSDRELEGEYNMLLTTIGAV